MDEFKTLEVLNTPRVKAKFKGEEIEIKPFNVGKFIKSLQYINRITNFNTDLQDQFNNLSVIFNNDQAALFTTIAKLLADHADDVMEIISIAIERERKDLDDLEMDEMTVIVKEIWEINKDFFDQRIRPMFPSLRPSTDEANPETQTISQSA